MDPATFSIILTFALGTLGFVVGLFLIRREQRQKDNDARPSR